MTTRQHLMEQDCMDQLGWGVHRVANATDEEMLFALKNWRKKSSREIVVPVVLPKESVVEKQICQEGVSRRDPVVLPRQNMAEKPIHQKEVYRVDKLRECIRLKVLCMTSEDLLEDDINLLKVSVRNDNLLLEQELNAIRDQIDVKRTEESKKVRVRDLMHKCTQSVGGKEDLLYLATIDGQLLCIQKEVETLGALLEGSL